MNRRCQPKKPENMRSTLADGTHDSEFGITSIHGPSAVSPTLA